MCIYIFMYIYIKYIYMNIIIYIDVYAYMMYIHVHIMMYRISQKNEYGCLKIGQPQIHGLITTWFHIEDLPPFGTTLKLETTPYIAHFPDDVWLNPHRLSTNSYISYSCVISTTMPARWGLFCFKFINRIHHSYIYHQFKREQLVNWNINQTIYIINHHCSSLNHHFSRLNHHFEVVNSPILAV